VHQSPHQTGSGHTLASWPPGWSVGPGPLPSLCLKPAIIIIINNNFTFIIPHWGNLYVAPREAPWCHGSDSNIWRSRGRRSTTWAIRPVYVHVKKFVKDLFRRNHSAESSKF
jgi:hypothetical protein